MENSSSNDQKRAKKTWMMMDLYGFMDYMDYGLWMDYNIIKSLKHHISGLWIYMNLYGFMVYTFYKVYGFCLLCDYLKIDHGFYYHGISHWLMGYTQFWFMINSITIRGAAHPSTATFFHTNRDSWGFNLMFGLFAHSELYYLVW